MNAQETFDTVVKHLRQQQRRSEDNAGSCKYRYKGLKCAVGCLIPDEKYKLECEFKTISEAFVICGLEVPSVEIRRMLYELQQIHDTYQISVWEERFQEVANQFGVTYERP